MSNKTLSRFAAVGGTAVLLSSVFLTLGASVALATVRHDVVPGDITRGTANPPLSGNVCKTGDFNFVIDMSGSIGDQGPGRPENLTALKAGINGFVDAFALAGGDGRYAGVKFNDDSSSIITTTAGYKTADVFKPRVNLLSGPTGLTPTATGINMGAANDAGDRAGVPNVMFVLTDGSPNKPNTHGDDLTNKDTWLQAANAAVDAANAARAGSDKYVVNAVYLSTPTDPGDTNLPWDDAGDKAWATEVMDQIGGGSHFNDNFNSFIDTLFKAIDCPLPETSIHTHASGTVEVGGKVHDVATLAGGDGPTGTITFKLYGPDNATCEGNPVFTNEKSVDGNGDYTSNEFTTTAAGTYRWIASYSGDQNNAGASGKCNDANESVVVTEPKVPDLDVTKLVTTDEGDFGHTNTALPGDTLDYKITIHNSGNGDATDVAVYDDITDLLAHSDYNNDCSDGCTMGAGDVLTWNIASIAAGTTKVLTFSVDLDDAFPDGTTKLPNTVVVVGPGSNCPRAEGTEDCDTTTTVSKYLLSIDKSNNAPLVADLPTADEGDTVTYTLSYHVGDLPVSGAVITDKLPNGVEYLAGTATSNGDFSFETYDSTTRTLSWTAEEDVTEDGTLTYQVKIAEDAAELKQPLTNHAQITSEQTGSDEAQSDVYVPAEVQAETSVPTPPSTDLFGGDGSNGPGMSFVLILAALGGLALGIGVFTPVPAKVRRRNRR